MTGTRRCRWSGEGDGDGVAEAGDEHGPHAEDDMDARRRRSCTVTEACKAGAPGVVEYVVMKKGDTPPGGMFVVGVRVHDPEAGAVREGVQGGHLHVVQRCATCVSLRWGCPWHGRLCVQDAVCVCVWRGAGGGPQGVRDDEDEEGREGGGEGVQDRGVRHVGRWRSRVTRRACGERVGHGRFHGLCRRRTSG